MLGRSSLGLVLSVFFTVVACGKTVQIGSDRADPQSCSGSDCSPNGSDGGDTLTPDARTPAADDGVVACPYGLPADLPNDPTATYHRHCATKADCAIAYHYMDCCGNRRAIGIEASEAARFAVGICGDGLPGGPVCDCPEAKPTAEDGERSSTFDPQDIEVLCENEICQTHVTTFACGDSVCDSRTQYCQKFIPGITSPDGGVQPPSYRCEAIPTACADTPDCACMMNGMPAGNTCEESNGHVTLTLVGI